MSSTLLPYKSIQIKPVTGHDGYGKPIFGTSRTENCSVVHLNRETQRTTVRADSSASRGYGDDWVSTTKILLRPDTVAKLGDQIVLGSHVLRITSLEERYGVFGYLDHFEVKADVWE